MAEWHPDLGLVLRTPRPTSPEDHERRNEELKAKAEEIMRKARAELERHNAEARTLREKEAARVRGIEAQKLAGNTLVAAARAWEPSAAPPREPDGWKCRYATERFVEWLPVWSEPLDAWREFAVRTVTRRVEEPGNMTMTRDRPAVREEPYLEVVLLQLMVYPPGFAPVEYARLPLALARCLAGALRGKGASFAWTVRRFVSEYVPPVRGGSAYWLRTVDAERRLTGEERPDGSLSLVVADVAPVPIPGEVWPKPEREGLTVPPPLRPRMAEAVERLVDTGAATPEKEIRGA